MFVKKAYIIKCLLANPDQLDIVLDDIVHYVVTKEEHNRLTSYSRANKDVDGWGRYRGAGIEVIDMLTGNLSHNAEKQTGGISNGEYGSTGYATKSGCGV
jgi:hypothetical protein